MNKYALVTFLLILLEASARKHYLRLMNEQRPIIHISQFGFFRGGILEVTVNALTLKESTLDRNTHLIGFTVDRTLTDGITPYPHTMDSTNCALRQDKENLNAEGVQRIAFSFDLIKNIVNVGCSHTMDQVRLYSNISDIPHLNLGLLSKGTSSSMSNRMLLSRKRRAFAAAAAAPPGTPAVVPVEPAKQPEPLSAKAEVQVSASSSSPVDHKIPPIQKPVLSWSKVKKMHAARALKLQRKRREGQRRGRLLSLPSPTDEENPQDLFSDANNFYIQQLEESRKSIVAERERSQINLLHVGLVFALIGCVIMGFGFLVKPAYILFEVGLIAFLFGLYILIGCGCQRHQERKGRRSEAPPVPPHFSPTSRVQSEGNLEVKGLCNEGLETTEDQLMLFNEQLSKLKKESKLVGLGYMIPTRIITKPKFDGIPEESEDSEIGSPPSRGQIRPAASHSTFKEITTPITPPTPEEEVVPDIDITL